MRNEDYRNSQDWLRFRTHWLRDNPPLDNGYYLCGICGYWVSGDEVTLDHIMPRTPANMFDISNIQPAHGLCNYNKGSRHWEPVINAESYEFLYKLSNM